MVVTVVGAGAIGGVTGAALARAGHDVLLVDQAADHVAAMNARGLAIATPAGAGPFRCARSRPTPCRRPSSWCCSPSRRSTPRALDGSRRGWRRGRGRVPPERAQRGADRGAGGRAADRRLPRQLGGGLGGAGANPARRRGTFVLGELDGGSRARAKELAKLLGAVAPTQVTANISGYKWAKHVYGALLVATALVDAHVYEVVERSPEVQRMLVALVAEGMAVAEAAGIRLEAFDEYDPAWYRAAGAGDAGAVARAMAAIVHALPAPHQDQDRHLARPRRAQAEDRGRGARWARRSTRAGRLGLRGPADAAAHRADRGARDRPPRRWRGRTSTSSSGQALTSEQHRGRSDA